MLSCQVSFSELTTLNKACVAPCLDGAERPRQKGVGDVVKVYTVEEVASILRVEYKTVLRLVKRGWLKVLPGIRHKRIPEAELDRYMNVRSILANAAGNGSADVRNGAGQSVVQPTGHSARSSDEDGVSNGQIVVKLNGKGRGAASCVVKPKGRK